MADEPTNQLNEEQKREIGRMVREGISVEGIHAIVRSWQPQSLAQQQGYFDAVMGKRYYTRRNDPPYTAFVEYGLPPIDERNVVEGTVSKSEKEEE